MGQPHINGVVNHDLIDYFSDSSNDKVDDSLALVKYVPRPCATPSDFSTDKVDNSLALVKYILRPCIAPGNTPLVKELLDQLHL
jgi:hypothetical protein